MPRIRSIKPDFFLSEDVAALPLRTRLTWIGLWTHCDDHGVAKDNARLVQAAVWPLDDVTEADVSEDLELLVAGGLLVRYEAEGRSWVAVQSWHRHQAINKPSKTRNPPPPPALRDPCGCAHCSLPEDSRSGGVALPAGGEGKGREGKGGEGTRTRPARKCPEHLHDPTSPPCGACKDARIAHDTWVAPRPPPPTCPEHPGNPLPCPEHIKTPMPEELRAQLRKAGRTPE